MLTYNGFSSNHRAAAGAWLLKERKAGRIPPPTLCQACGQTDGTIEYHAEDYSRPFGPHIAAFMLCCVCHNVLHQRFSYPEAWARYRAMVSAGWRTKPRLTGGGWASKLMRAGGWVEEGAALGLAQTVTLLDRVEAGEFRVAAWP